MVIPFFRNRPGTKMKTTTRILSLGALAALLAACGGGGDDGPAQPPATIPLAAAMASQISLAKSGSVTITGSLSAPGQQTANVTGTGTYTESTTAGSFEGITGLRKHLTLTGSVTVSGQSAPLSSSSDAFYDSNNKPLGATASGSYCVTTAYTPLAVSAQAGSSGNWYSQDCYSSSAKLAKAATSTVTYAVEADSANSLLLKLTTRVTDTAGNSLPATTTYRVTSAGAATRLTDVSTVSVNGASLNLTVTYQ